MIQRSLCVLITSLFFAASAFGQADLVSVGNTNVAANPSTIEANAGWAPDATLAILFDSRAQMITNPGGGFGGADASVLQGTSTSFGATVGGTTAFRIAEDFVVPAPGWTLSAVTVYAYQTLATPSTVSTFTGMNLRIWDGDPSLPTSTVLFGDTTTNRLTASTFSGIYRASSTAPTNGQRAIIGNTSGALSVVLPAGTYWLDWQLAGSTASGPFAPFVTVVGQNATGNAIQFNPATSLWVPITDAGSTFPQTMPYTLEGTVNLPDSIFVNGFET
ncbi:MAG: hypothetical protein ABI411_03785 [Tahibacter sp.]